uniref:KY-like immunoglobulin-like domain-containing protein n=1 Tax=Strigamia maritima TaxID=126957 RepID=T1J201_STRMM
MPRWLLRLLSDWINGRLKDDTITTASGSTSGIKCDGVIHQRNRKEYLLHLLIKPAFKEGVPEALSYYYRYTCEKIKTAKDPKITNCCHPAIIFFYDGYVLFLYGAVITHQVSVQPLIRPIDLMAVDALIEFSAVLYALDKSLGELDNFYDKEQEQIAHFPIIRYTNLEEYEFKRENMKNIVPAEEYMKIDYEDGEQVVRDCVDAHKLCAERGFAPRVKYHEDNKTYHVVICERFEGGRFSNEIKTQLRNVLDALHEGGFVFGDLRPPNILMDEKSRVNLIDFDWSGRDGVDRYPELVNSQIKPDGVFVIERCKVQMEPKADSPFVFSVGDQDKKTFLFRFNRKTLQNKNIAERGLFKVRHRLLQLKLLLEKRTGQDPLQKFGVQVQFHSSALKLPRSSILRNNSSYSKSAGYQPGVCFEDNRFRNSWNVVVQCNWGARHLVNAKQAPRPGTKGKADSLRYEYDDHYFLTDPREFIYEFFLIQTEWQLLRQSITLREFEELPFVRSLFFRYKLYFPDAERIRAVMATDNTGVTTIRIGIPAPLSSTLIFHSSDGDSYDNISLKRFVMQSVIGNTVTFRVHGPCSDALLLDVFANSVTHKEYLLEEPMKFKSATRLFGLIPITHRELIFASRQLDVQFRTSRPLLTDFMATMHENGVEEKKLGKFVSHSGVEDVVTFLVNFPKGGHWVKKKYSKNLEYVSIPPSPSGTDRSMSVLPYLDNLHYGFIDDSEEEFITERQLNEQQQLLDANANNTTEPEKTSTIEEKKHKKSTSCMNVRKLSTCKQS